MIDKLARFGGDWKRLRNILNEVIVHIQSDFEVTEYPYCLIDCLYGDSRYMPIGA